MNEWQNKSARMAIEAIRDEAIRECAAVADNYGDPEIRDAILALLSEATRKR